MKEIKFRAWAHASKVMFKPDSNDGWDFLDGHVYDLPNTTLMQYTGLKDKNGKEIYEGDILSHPGTMEMNAGICCVEYDADFAKYVGKRGDLSMRCNMAWLGEYGEVIGNIYENPELVGG